MCVGLVSKEFLKPSSKKTEQLEKSPEKTDDLMH